MRRPKHLRRWAMANYVCIRCGTFRADITAEGIIGLGITKIRKLCRVMKQDPRESQEAVSVIRDTFPGMLEAAKDKWHNAGVAFQNEYRLPERGRTRNEKALIRAENKKLLMNVQRAKAAYETLVKKQEIFEKEIT